MTRAMRIAFPWTRTPAVDAAGFRAATRDETVRVAARDGRVAGFAGLSAPAAFLHHLYVDPRDHLCGVGRALLADARVHLGPTLSLKCQTGNTGARAFYRACGLEESSDPGGVDEIGPWIWVRASASAG